MWDDDTNQDSDLVKRLRSEIKDREQKLAAKDEELKARGDELATLRPMVRTNTVKDILSGLKVNPKVAALIPQDVTADKDSVAKWLTEYGDVLGVAPGDGQESTEETVNTPSVQETPQDIPGLGPEAQQTWARIQSQDASAGTTTPDAEAQQLAQLTAAFTNAKSSDEFFTFLQGGAPTQ